MAMIHPEYFTAQLSEFDPHPIQTKDAHSTIASLEQMLQEQFNSVKSASDMQQRELKTIDKNKTEINKLQALGSMVFNVAVQSSGALQFFMPRMYGIRPARNPFK